MNLSDLRKLLRLFENSEIDELEIEQDGSRVRLKRGSPSGPPSQEPPDPIEVTSRPVSSDSEALAPGTMEDDLETSPNNRIFSSPIVGTFYRASTPKSEPYIRVGQTIHQGENLCVIEAMKVMNEIESDISGKVIKIYPDNGDPVEYGEPLFLIEISPTE